MDKPSNGLKGLVIGALVTLVVSQCGQSVIDVIKGRSSEKRAQRIELVRQITLDLDSLLILDRTYASKFGDDSISDKFHRMYFSDALRLPFERLTGSLTAGSFMREAKLAELFDTTTARKYREITLFAGERVKEMEREAMPSGPFTVDTDTSMVLGSSKMRRKTFEWVFRKEHKTPRIPFSNNALVFEKYLRERLASWKAVL